MSDLAAVKIAEALMGPAFLPREDLAFAVEVFDALDLAVRVRAEPLQAGAPAIGWVRALLLNGDTLLADLEDVPQPIADAITAGNHGAIYGEFIEGLTVNGKTYRISLSAVCVAGLSPALVNALYSIPPKNIRDLSQTQEAIMATQSDPSAALSDLALAYMRQHPHLTFKAALKVVCSTEAGARLHRQYCDAAKSKPTTTPTRPVATFEQKPSHSRTEIDALVDAKARALLAKDPKMRYAAACSAVFRADKALAAQYAAAHRGE